MVTCNHFDLFFISYEAMQTPPLLFQWQHGLKTIEIRPEDILCKGELITKEETMSLCNKQAYILTKLYLFKCTNGSFIDTSNVIAGLELRNPNIKKIENPNTNLYLFLLTHPRFGFSLKGYKGVHTFYCATKEERERWYKSLKKVCVLCHLKRKYNLGELLGKGTFAKVYLATKIKNKTQFAVKSIKKKLLFKTANNMDCLIKGIRVLRYLNHPNIIKLYEIYESANHVHLVMEYIKGEDLFSHLKLKGVYSEKDSSLLIMQVLEVLNYCHSLNVIHRDLKPENLMIV